MTDEVGQSKKSKKARRAGQIVKRGDEKWLLRIFLGRDPATGKKRYHSETFIGSQRGAQTKLRQLFERHQLGLPLRESDISLGQFLDDWLKAVKLRVRERTYTHYENIVSLYVRPELGDRRLIDVTAGAIQELYSKLESDNLSSATRSYVHILLKNAFKLAFARDLIRRNPMSAVVAPSLKMREVEAMNLDQVRAFLKAIAGQREEAILRFALFSGARPAEYLALKWSDIDWTAKTVTFRRSIVWRNPEEWYLTEPKTQSARRTIPLVESILQTLTEHRTRQLEERMRVGACWQNQDFVFTTTIGEPINLQNLRYTFKQTLKAAGLPETFRLYSTRHTSATELLRHGINMKVVSERLGHSDPRITLEFYSHVTEGLQQEASEAIEKVISG